MAIPANKVISGATNATPIVVTSAGHGYSTGNTVQIINVGGNLAANGIWTIIVLDANSYSLNGSVGNGAYTSGGSSTLVASGVAVNLDQTAIDVNETTQTTGTGSVSLVGTAVGGVPFGVLADGAKVEYKISSADGLEFETGIGTFNKAANTIARDEVISSNAGEVSAAKINLSAGDKQVSAVVFTSELTEAGQGQLSITATPANAPTDGGIPSPVNNGIFCMPNRRGVLLDADRCGPAAAVIYYRRRGIDFENLRLLQTTQDAVGDAPLTAAQLIRRYVDVQLVRLVDEDPTRLTLDVSAASALPFTVDGAKIPVQTHTIAMRPADVFVYMPHRIPGRPQVYPQLFYLNWFSSTARNNENGGDPNGHAISTLNDWQFLDVTGPFSTFIADTAATAKVPHRYLFLGTIGGLTDSTVVCTGNKRMVWNRVNKMAFINSATDATRQWSPPGARLALARNRFSRMNAANWTVAAATINDSPWSFHQITGSSANWAAMSVSVDARGNLRVKVTAYDAAGSGIDLRETNIITDQQIGVAETADIANDADVRTRRFELQSRRMPLGNIGFRSYRVMEAVGAANGVMTDTPYFIGQNTPSIFVNGTH